MELNKHDIAERFAALAPGKQKEFLAALPGHTFARRFFHE